MRVSETDGMIARAPLWRRSRPLMLTLLVSSGVTLIALRAMPEGDVAFSRQFFTVQDCSDGSTVCGSFALAYSPAWMALRESIYAVIKLTGIGSFAWLLWLLFVENRTTLDDLLRPLLAVTSLLLGPLLLVNLWLKEWAGRARPFQTEDFGGAHPYTSPGDFVANCASNCSFPSGEAAGAFWLLVIVPLVPRRWRAVALAGILAFAVCVALLRVSFGRHYFSDVTMAAFISLTAIAFCGWALQRPATLRAVERLTRWSNGIAGEPVACHNNQQTATERPIAD